MKCSARDVSIKVKTILLVLNMSICFSACDQSVAKIQSRTETQPLPYKILYDEMTARMSIGVDSEISEDQLKATLCKAADDHQNDAARDYLTADHLWVEAYLLLQEKRSGVAAGRLGRYVPPRDPNAANQDQSTKKDDQFFITLEEAKRNLR